MPDFMDEFIEAAISMPDDSVYPIEEFPLPPPQEDLVPEEVRCGLVSMEYEQPSSDNTSYQSSLSDVSLDDIPF